MSSVPALARRRFLLPTALGWTALVALGLAMTATSVSAPAGADLQEGPSAADSLLVPQFEEAFGAGDAETLLRDAATRVELSLFGRASFYSRTQALFVMRDFFRRYPPEAVTFRDQSIGVGTRTLLGLYEERGGGQCQVAVRLRQRRNAWEVVAVRLDRTGTSIVSGE